VRPHQQIFVELVRALGHPGIGPAVPGPVCRGLHSFASQLNLSSFDGIGGARRGCDARVKGVLGGVQVCVGYFLLSSTAHVELRSRRV